MQVLTLGELLKLAEQYSDAKANNTFAPCNSDFLIQNMLVHLVRLKNIREIQEQCIDDVNSKIIHEMLYNFGDIPELVEISDTIDRAKQFAYQESQNLKHHV